MGGKQFVVVVQSLEIDKFEQKLRRISSVAQIPFNIYSDDITASLDISCVFYPDDADSDDTLLKSLSDPQYDVLASGSQFLKTFAVKIKKSEEVKKKIASLMKNAIQKNEFSLSFQAKVDSKNEAVLGAETLIRWNNKELGSVSPVLFIPLAEEIGYIDEITKWTVSTLCGYIKDWKKSQGLSFPISINISQYEFCKDNFADDFMKELKKQGVKHENIELEITERALDKNSRRIAEQIKKLKGAGFKILVDDFGTGNSTMNYLEKLDVDVLKIDREFIKDYPEKDNGGIAKIIMNLAEALKLEVIAEGVENIDQLKFLNSIGCYMIQGYYYTKPVIAKEFVKVIKDGKISSA